MRDIGPLKYLTKTFMVALTVSDKVIMYVLLNRKWLMFLLFVTIYVLWDFAF